MDSSSQQRGRSPSASLHHIRHSPSPSPQPAFLTSHDPSAPFATPPYDLAPSAHYLVPPEQQHFAISNSNSVLLDGIISAAGPLPDQQSIDPAFLLDPELLDPLPESQSINPATLMNPMATVQPHPPTPPHLLNPDMNRTSSVSPHASPSMTPGAFPSPGHSRHVSLDPASAAYPHNADWSNVYRPGHHRAPSDTYSEASSAHPSPYLGNSDSFDHDNPSPLLNPQADSSMFQDVMNFGQFTISDSHSPGHSPHISPRLMPQQHSLPAFTAANNFGLAGEMNNQFANPGTGMDYLQGHVSEPFPPLPQGDGMVDMCPADQMSPPEIKFDFAPPSRQQTFENQKQSLSQDALSPPTSRSNRGRLRARSDPFSGASSRASTPGAPDGDSLSPEAAAQISSRSPSPSTKSSRRSSTSNIPHRDYILDLADPSRPASTQSGPDGSIKGRTQKHPATFQCSLCPKRFTRAYNLRSHLRTHTDERPFVCSVCGKAFARQHDRKRHEGLHSGEKKFVCRGVLKDNNNWGCGRRFARADALGRHFRSEAGRVCIRPLLEEEAREKNWDAHTHMDSQAGMMGGMPPMGHMHMQGAPGYEGYPSVSGGMEPHGLPMQHAPHPGAPYGLPAAILAQYPALAGIQWDTLPPGPPDEMEGDISGRSSFDASSGGEMFDEDEGEYTGHPAGTAYGWASDSGM